MIYKREFYWMKLMGSFKYIQETTEEICMLLWLYSLLNISNQAIESVWDCIRLTFSVASEREPGCYCHQSERVLAPGQRPEGWCLCSTPGLAHSHYRLPCIPVLSSHLRSQFPPLAQFEKVLEKAWSCLEALSFPVQSGSDLHPTDCTREQS